MLEDYREENDVQEEVKERGVALKDLIECRRERVPERDEAVEAWRGVVIVYTRHDFRRRATHVQAY